MKLKQFIDKFDVKVNMNPYLIFQRSTIGGNLRLIKVPSKTSPKYTEYACCAFLSKFSNENKEVLQI